MSNLSLGNTESDGATISKVEEALNSVGIKLRENETTFRNFGDVIDDLAGVWQNLNDIERANISQQIAGKVIA